MSPLHLNEGSPEYRDYLNAKCGICSSQVRFIQRSLQSPAGQHYAEEPRTFDILECPSCHAATVANATSEALTEYEMKGVFDLIQGSRNAELFRLSPGVLPMQRVKNMPPDLIRAWEEVLRCGQVDAWTSAEIMCRKILMHVAVDQFDVEAGKSFQFYVQTLDDQRFFPSPMTPVIDGIRKRGNAATHELAQSSSAEAIKTMEITHHVLRTIYELSM